MLLRERMTAGAPEASCMCMSEAPGSELSPSGHPVRSGDGSGCHSPELLLAFGEHLDAENTPQSSGWPHKVLRAPAAQRPWGRGEAALRPAFRSLLLGPGEGKRASLS